MSELLQLFFVVILCQVFNIFILISTVMVCLNQKRIQSKYRVDNVIIFMLIYILNFTINSVYFNFLPFYLIPISITLLMVMIILFFSDKTIIGLTGGIACGKSQASQYLNNVMKIPIADCDLIARKIVEPGKPAYLEIVKKFGNGILCDDKTIDRTKLGSLIFPNKTLRKSLMKTTNYYILKQLLYDLYVILFKNKEKMVVIDAPLLFETPGMRYFCYPNIVLFLTDQSLQIQRLAFRDKINEEEARKKIDSQMPLTQKMKLADILVCNDGSINDMQEDLLTKLSRIYMK